MGGCGAPNRRSSSPKMVPHKFPAQNALLDPAIFPVRVPNACGMVRVWAEPHTPDATDLRSFGRTWCTFAGKPQWILGLQRQKREGSLFVLSTGTGLALGGSDRNRQKRLVDEVSQVAGARCEDPTRDPCPDLREAPAAAEHCSQSGHPHGKPVKERHKEDFLAHIAAAFRDDPDVDPEQVVQAVFRVLSKHVTSGEIEGVKRSLPTEIRSPWT
jgi:hypothetical protein